MATSGSWEISWQSSYWNTTANPKYYHWKGKWAKSGNTIRLYDQQLWLTFTQSSWGSGTDTVTTTGGSAQSVTFSPSGGTTSNVVSLNDSSFSVTSSQTSATIQCVIDGEVTGSTTINFDATIIAPTVPTVSATALVSAIDIDYGTTSFGQPSSGTVSLYGGTSTNPTTQIASKTTTGTSTVRYDTSVVANTAYYFRARATNGSATSNYSSTVTAVTRPYSIRGLSIASSTGDSVVITYEAITDGGYYDKIVEYSLDGGVTWNTGATITGGSAQSGTFTITGLTQGEEYYLQVRARTTAGNSAIAVLAFTAGGIYGVGPEGKQITRALGSVNGIATELTQALGSVNGIANKL